MQDQSVGQVSDALLLFDGYLFTACAAVIILYDLSGYHRLEGGYQSLLILDLELKSVELLVSADDVSTTFAHS